MTTDEINEILHEELAKVIQEEVDAEILRELDCVARNWTRVELPAPGYDTAKEITAWCKAHFKDQYRCFECRRYYFVVPEHATFFIMRWS